MATKEEKVAKLIELANKGKGDHREAVLAAIDLPPEKVNDGVREYIAEHAGVVFEMHQAADAAVAEAEKVVADAEKVVAEAEKAAAAADHGLRVNQSAAKERLAQAVHFTHRTITVLRLWNATEMGQRFNLSKGYVSKLVLAGKAAGDLGVEGAPTKVANLVTMAGEQRSKLQGALTQDGRTYESVVAALAEKPEETPSTPDAAPQSRTEQEQARGNGETPGVDAHRTARRLAKLLVMLNRNGEWVADVGKVTGAAALKEVAVALTAYQKRIEAAPTVAKAETEAVSA